MVWGSGVLHWSGGVMECRYLENGDRWMRVYLDLSTVVTERSSDHYNRLSCYA